MAAKLNGWAGGQEFFIVKDQQGFLKQLENGMGVYGGDASELGMKFVGFLKNNHQDIPKQMENFITICNEGGFTVEIGDEPD